MTRLVIGRDNKVVQEIALTDRDLRIGRSPDNDVVLDDGEKNISRIHAELRHEQTGWVLLDLNSQNGIWENGQRRPRIVLQPGKPVSIGPFTLTLAVPVAAAAAAPSLDATRVDIEPPRKPGMNETAVFERPAPRPPGTPQAGPTSGAAPAAARVKAPRRSPLEALLALPRMWLLAGFVAVAIVAVAATSMLRPSSNVPAHADVTPEAAAAETAALITEKLAASRDAAERGDYDGALAALDEILRIAPEHEEALALQTAARAALEQRASADQAMPAPAAAAETPAPAAAAATPPAAPAAERPPATTRPSTAGSGTPRRAATAASSPAREQARDFERRVTQAREANERGRYPEAIRLLEPVVRDDPDFPGARDTLRSARAALRTQAEELVSSGQQLEANGQVAEAVDAYERALALVPDLEEADAARAAARGKLQANAEAAYRRARQYDALARNADALREYEAALAGLPDSDPRRASILERIDALKGARPE